MRHCSERRASWRSLSCMCMYCPRAGADLTCLSGKDERGKPTYFTHDTVILVALSPSVP